MIIVIVSTKIIVITIIKIIIKYNDIIINGMPKLL